jgi:hypothetical protein
VPSAEQHLERHHSIQGDLAGLIDDAHAASPQLAKDFVSRKARQHFVLG